MRFTNLHTHSRYCDGSDPLENYVKEAIKLKMQGLGFSGHAPIGFSSKWHMKKEDWTNYINEIHQLQKKYKDQIEISKGLEIDYIKNSNLTFPFDEETLDYTIGSVHYVGQYNDLEFCGIDYTRKEFERGLKEIFKGDIQKMVKEYYDSIIEMIQKNKVTIIGHLDLIKKLNKDNRYFNEEAKWYKEIIKNTLAVISKTDSIVEINTRGNYKGYADEFYPSNWIIKCCLKEQIKLTINSDAHNPKELLEGYDRVLDLLKELGAKTYFSYVNRAWVEMNI